MTDRIRVVTVVLDRDYRDDDVTSILNAIRMVKGVDDLTVEVVDGAQHMSRDIAKSELRRELIDQFSEMLAPSWMKK